MSNQIMQVVTPVLNVVIVAILGYVGQAVVKLAPKAIDLLVSKIGLTNYQRIKAIASDIWNIVEEDGRLGKLTTSKIQAFETHIKLKIPGITDEEINTIRQAIAGEFNKNKLVIEKAIDYPIKEVRVEPTIKVAATIDNTEAPKEG